MQSVASGRLAHLARARIAASARAPRRVPPSAPSAAGTSHSLSAARSAASPACVVVAFAPSRASASNLPSRSRSTALKAAEQVRSSSTTSQGRPGGIVSQRYSMPFMPLRHQFSGSSRGWLRSSFKFC